MASFNTHLNVGVSISGIAASAVVITGLATPIEALVYWGLGALGSLLPDLDADKSIPTKVGVGFLSIALAFAAVFVLANVLPSIFELISVWICAFIFFRYLVFALVTRLTVHRGLFHSIPASIALGLTITVLATQLMHQNPQRAWLAGIFIAFGYLVHLFLDELYSIDWSGKRLRRSFGSACKIWSHKNWLGMTGLYVACVGLYFLSPSPYLFIHSVSTKTDQRSLVETIPIRHSQL